MPVRILILECSSPTCSVALSIDGNTALMLKGERQNSHAEVITLLIDQLMQEAGASLRSLDAICHSNGPGSYTGLRVGASTAKGIAYGLQLPVICISTLKGLAAGAVHEIAQNDLICPMIDARRMEVYNAIYDRNLNEILAPQASIVDESFMKDELSAQKIWFCGDGMPKSQSILSAYSNARFIDNIEAQANHFSRLAYEYFQRKEFADTAYFEPFYLKNYEAKLPKKIL